MDYPTFDSKSLNPNLNREHLEKQAASQLAEIIWQMALDEIYKKENCHDDSNAETIS
jgi:hypothetical protein